MMSGDYAFITLDFTVLTSWQTRPWVGARNMNEFMAVFDGIVNLSVKEPHGERFENYSRQLNELIKANNVSQTPSVSSQPLEILHISSHKATFTISDTFQVFQG